MLYIFYMHFTLIVSVFMLSICDTEINQSKIVPSIINALGYVGQTPCCKR